jgi:ribokinase
MLRPIVVVGSINLDLVVGADRIPLIGETITGNRFQTFHGGKGANQAVAAAKLGYPVAMVGNVGSDAFGSQLRDGLEAVGVDTKHVSTVEGPSGIALITIGSGGENSIVVVPGANNQLTPALLQKALPILERAGFILAQLEIPLETVEYLSAFATERDIPFMLDPAPARELPNSLLRNVSWLTPNETEAQELLSVDVSCADNRTYPAADLLLQCGVKNVIVKLGAGGCVIAQGSSPQKVLPAFSVKALDTTGAGDAFNAGFSVGLMRGYSVGQSAVFASAVAAISVTRPGAQPSMPDANEVELFLSQHSEAFSYFVAPVERS